MNITLEQEQEMLNLLEKGCYLNELPYQNEIICKKAVEDYAFDIQCVKSEFLTEELKLIAVKKDGYSLEFIKNPSIEVQLEAVKQEGYVLKFIKNPSIEVQLEAVKNDGYAIQFIENPSIELQLEAIKKNGCAIKFIQNPSMELKLLAINQNALSIKYIKNPSIEVQLQAVKNKGYAIQYITNPSIEVQIESVKESGYAIQYISNQTDELKQIALKQSIQSYKYFNSDYKTKNLKVFALKSTNKNCRNILAEFINNQWLFTIGCQEKITKKTFIDRIYNTNEGLEENPHRKEYLKVLKKFNILFNYIKILI